MPYGRIQEQGGVTGPHDILPVRKLALRFVTPGFIGAIRLTQGGKISRKQGAGITFAKAVHHPGSRIPGNPYLEPAVRGNAGFIEERWRQAVSRGLNGGSSGG